jgi:hypothetical protein
MIDPNNASTNATLPTRVSNPHKRGLRGRSLGNQRRRLDSVL